MWVSNLFVISAAWMLIYSSPTHHTRRTRNSRINAYVKDGWTIFSWFSMRISAYIPYGAQKWPNSANRQWNTRNLPPNGRFSASWPSGYTTSMRPLKHTKPAYQFDSRRKPCAEYSSSTSNEMTQGGCLVLWSVLLPGNIDGILRFVFPSPKLEETLLTILVLSGTTIHDPQINWRRGCCQGPQHRTGYEPAPDCSWPHSPILSTVRNIPQQRQRWLRWATYLVASIIREIRPKSQPIPCETL